MAITEKFSLEEHEVSITKIDISHEDSLTIDEDIDFSQEKTAKTMSTSNVDCGIDVIDNSYRFTINPQYTQPPKRKKYYGDTKYEAFISKIDEIIDKPLSEVELIEYIDNLAHGINSLLEIEEKKKNYDGIVKLSNLMSNLYNKAHDVLLCINSDNSVKYGLYSSFWSLKSDLSRREI